MQTGNESSAKVQESVEIPKLEWQENIPPIKLQRLAVPTSGSLKWNIELKGINLASFSIRISDQSSGDMRILESVVATSPAISLVKKLHDESISKLNTKTKETEFFRYESRYSNSFSEHRPESPTYKIEISEDAVKRTKVQQWPKGTPLFDTSSFLFGLSNWTPQVGHPVEANVIRINAIWRVQLHPKGDEDVTLKQGVMPATKVIGISRALTGDLKFDAESRRFTIWLSKKNGLPVKISSETFYGDILATATWNP